MLMSNDQFSKVLRYGNMLNETEISGQAHLNYILEEPGKREQLADKIYEIKRSVAEDDLRASDKEHLLSRADRQLKLLETETETEDEVGVGPGSYLKPKVRDIIGVLLGMGATYSAIKTNETMQANRKERIKENIMEYIVEMISEIGIRD